MRKNEKEREGKTGRICMCERDKENGRKVELSRGVGPGTFPVLGSWLLSEIITLST